MTAILTAITLGVLSGALHAQWPEEPIPVQTGQPGQVDNPHWGDIFSRDTTACPDNGGPPCGSEILGGRPRGGVSARTLGHKHSKAASQAFDRGVRAWKKRQGEQAVRYLSEAVRLDPDFLEARTDLGIVYTKTDRPEEALVQYELALGLEPNIAALHSNKAAALVMLSRCEEAEQAARRALQLDPESIEANYMLGIAMMKQLKITPETAAHLAIAAKKYPRARAYLAEVRAYLAAVPKR
jgi:Flp pilus assembly protein TadD